MTRGEGIQSKVHLKGQHDDFLVFVDDVEIYKKWKTDKSIPLTHFISLFKIFLTHKQGAQGAFDGAPKTTLASEFDMENQDECIKKILEEGSIQTAEIAGRQGPKNDSMTSMNAK